MDFKDDLYHHVLDRFLRFDTATACGRWDEKLLADFRSDERFYCDARQMLEFYISRELPDCCRVGDGLELHSVRVDAGVSMNVRFHHWLLDPNVACPASYLLSAVAPTVHRVDFACGHADDHGRFKYKYDDEHCGRYGGFPERADDWALYISRYYGVASETVRAGVSSVDQPPLSRYMKNHQRRGR